MGERDQVFVSFVMVSSRARVGKYVRSNARKAVPFLLQAGLRPVDKIIPLLSETCGVSVWRPMQDKL